MSTDFSFVPRPDLQRIKWLRVTEAIVATVETNKAVRVPLNGQDVRQVRHALRRAVNRRGLRFRGLRENGHLVCWAEEMPDEHLQR